MRLDTAFLWRDDGNIVARCNWPWHSLPAFSCKQCRSPGELDGGSTDGVFMAVHCGTCNNRSWHVCTVCALLSESKTVLQGGTCRLSKHEITEKHVKSMAKAMTLLGPRPLVVPKTISVAERKRGMDDQRKRKEEMDKYFPITSQGNAYFRHEVMFGEPGAFELVRICHTTHSHSHYPQGSRLHLDEVRMFLAGCVKYWDMSRAQRDACVEHDWSLYCAGRRHQRREIALCSLPVSDCLPLEFDYTPIIPPRNGAELRRFLFSLESKTSLVSNLPTPSVQSHVPGHAVLDYTECIQHMFAHGIEVQTIGLESKCSDTSPYGWVDDTPRSDEIRAQAGIAIAAMPGKVALVIPFTTWQDDFDPNSSTKNNRGSVWAETASTFASRTARNPPDHTFVVALGRSKDNDHEAAQQCLRNNFHQMSRRPTKCFSKILGQPVQVLCYEYARLQDQPERRKDLCLLPGQSLQHPRFNVSCLACHLVPVLRTCSDCTGSLRQGVLPKGCKMCVCWDVLAGLASDAPGEILAKLKLGIPKHYPRTYLHNDLGIEYITADNRVLPFALSAERLQCSFDLVFSNLVEGRWTTNMASAFMRRECFMDPFAALIIRRALNLKSLQEIIDGTSRESDAHQGAIRRDAQKKPLEYQKPPSPTSWAAPGGLSIYLDVLMHLLFLGVVKSTLKTLRVWMCKQGKNQEFLRFTDKFDEVLRTTSGLDWLKCLEYSKTGKFGGWVSENFLGFSRLLKWFFQNICELRSASDDEDPGDLPVSSWRKGHYIHWLRVRGLKTDGVVNELKARRSEAMQQETPPPVLETVAGAFVPEQVQNMLVALDDMLSSIMVPEVVPGVTVPHMELKIKHFLTEFDLLDQQVKTKGAKPKVITSFNFLCLLNLPKLTERFGPLRNFWEGQRRGEMGIQEIKPLCTGGLPPKFEQHVSTKLLRGRALRFVRDSLATTGKTTDRKMEENVSEHLAKMRRSFKVMKDRDDVVRLLCDRKSVSVIVCTHKTAVDGPITWVFSAFGTQRGPLGFVGLQKTEDGASAIEKMGDIYQRWFVGMETLQEIPLPMSECCVSYGVLLPLLECYPSMVDAASVVHHTLVRSKRYGV